jgi:hypothetical protein
MRPAIRLALAMGAALLGALAPAQTPPAPPAAAKAATPTLHEAWLREILDLDVRGAAAAYAAVAEDHRPGNLDRWLATARLVELRRLGIAVPMVPALGDAPAPLRNPLAQAAQPLPVAELLQRAAADPQQLWKTIGTEAGRLPPLRPVTMLAEELRREQLPSLRAGVRRAQAANRNRAEANRTWDRFNANDILRAELEGRTDKAEAVRQAWFPEWRRPLVEGEPKAHLERVRTNLEALLRSTELWSGQRPLLTQLRDWLSDRTATDPSAALAMILRLPLYAEQLLAVTPETGR